jgi:hypothetical protein
MKPLDAALRYAEHDRVPVFPCREREPGRKRPYTGQGFYDASRDPLLIKETRDLVEYRDPLALAESKGPARDRMPAWRKRHLPRAGAFAQGGGCPSGRRSRPP